MEADKANERSGSPPEWKSKITMVIEVGWTQALGPITDDKTLLGKAKDWIDIDVSLVVAVKLYVVKTNENPGMLVTLVTDNEGVCRVIQEGEIPPNEMDLFQAYNDEYTGVRAAPVAEALRDVQTLEIEGKYILGFDHGDLEEQCGLFPQVDDADLLVQADKAGILARNQN